MWVTVSSSLQDGDSLQKPSVLDQLLQSASVRYLPDKSRAWTVAMATLVGEDDVVVQRGWGEDSDMNSGLKNSKEESGAASALSVCSQ